jgi:hypothetical protein
VDCCLEAEGPLGAFPKSFTLFRRRPSEGLERGLAGLPGNLAAINCPHGLDDLDFDSLPEDGCRTSATSEAFALSRGFHAVIWGLPQKSAVQSKEGNAGKCSQPVRCILYYCGAKTGPVERRTLQNLAPEEFLSGGEICPPARFGSVRQSAETVPDACFPRTVPRGAPDLCLSDLGSPGLDLNGRNQHTH